MVHQTTQTILNANGSQSQILTSTSEHRSFFDRSLGFSYNVQSAARIVSPACMLIAGLVCYWSYSKFPRGLAQAGGDPEAVPFLGGGEGADRPSGYGARVQAGH